MQWWKFSIQGNSLLLWKVVEWTSSTLTIKCNVACLQQGRKEEMYSSPPWQTPPPRLLLKSGVTSQILLQDWNIPPMAVQWSLLSQNCEWIETIHLWQLSVYRLLAWLFLGQNRTYSDQVKYTCTSSHTSSHKYLDLYRQTQWREVCNVDIPKNTTSAKTRAKNKARQKYGFLVIIKCEFL